MTNNIPAIGVAFLALSAASGPALADDTAVVQIDHVSCSGAPNEIRIVVNNVKETVGLITADLYRNQEEGFLKRAGRISQVRFAAKAPMTAFCMRAPADENLLAVAVYHDENANKSFDKKALGLPDEPYGVSNDPPMRFGPPKAAESVFEVGEDGADVSIKLRN